MTFQEAEQKCKELMDTPIEERPKYKEFYNRLKEVIDQVEGIPELGQTKELRQARHWMANREILQRIAHEEGEEYLWKCKQIMNQWMYQAIYQK